MIFILFVFTLFIMYVSIFSFIIYRIIRKLDFDISSRLSKLILVTIVIRPTMLYTSYLVGAYWNHNIELAKILFWGPIGLAIVVGIALRPRSIVSNSIVCVNDNSKDQNL